MMSQLDGKVWAGLLLLIPLVLAGRSAAQETSYLYGIHDHDTGQMEYLNRVSAGGAKGWVTATLAIGRNPDNHSGVDFRFISNAGHTVIGRLNHGYWTDGTIPPPQYYADFAQRCANFAAASQGCSIWIIGNETNLASEWPMVNGWRSYISPQQAAESFRLAYDAIKAVRPNHKVLSMPMAPWAGPYGAGSNHDAMPLNWVTYKRQMLEAIRDSTPGPHGTGPDGIGLHINSRGYTYNDIHSTNKINAGGQQLFFSFYVYKDWVDLGIPSNMWHLPLYATECNGNYYWKGGHPECTNPANPSCSYQPGWMQEIYAEINRYNTTVAPAQGKPVYRCINMYRWCAFCDGWNIDGSPPKGQILSDLDAAVAFKYRWDAPPTASFTGAPTSGNAPLTVNFTDQSTGGIESRSWNFGDNGAATAINPSRTYLNPGTYTVSLTVSGSGGDDTQTRTNYISVHEPPGCLAYTVANFEDYPVGSQATFRQPGFSSTTSGHLSGSPDVSTVTSEVPAFDGTGSCKVQWAWVDTSPDRWLRLTTSNTANGPNPAIDVRRPIRVRLRLDSGSFRLAAGVRETGVSVPVGLNGGTSGTIEWIGASGVSSGAPQGVLVTAQPGVWQTVTLMPGEVQPFTGDGVLAASNNKGVLEHLAFASTGGAGPFTVYLDGITQPCGARGDFDQDGDVDQTDFAHFQRCLSGAGIPPMPGCANADLDGDDDVDQEDFTLFQACMAGPNVTPPAACFD